MDAEEWCCRLPMLFVSRRFCDSDTSESNIESEWLFTACPLSKDAVAHPLEFLSFSANSCITADESLVEFFGRGMRALVILGERDLRDREREPDRE